MICAHDLQCMVHAETVFCSGAELRAYSGAPAVGRPSPARVACGRFFASSRSRSRRGRCWSVVALPISLPVVRRHLARWVLGSVLLAFVLLGDVVLCPLGCLPPGIMAESVLIHIFMACFFYVYVLLLMVFLVSCVSALGLFLAILFYLRACSSLAGSRRCTIVARLWLVGSGEEVCMSRYKCP